MGGPFFFWGGGGEVALYSEPQNPKPSTRNLNPKPLKPHIPETSAVLLASRGRGIFGMSLCLGQNRLGASAA